MLPLDTAPRSPRRRRAQDAPAALLEGLDPSQRAAVVDPGAPLAILAGAGSGKTRVLTRRIAWHAATENLDLDRVLAVTFTRKAAGELVRRLERLPEGGRVTAGTFHALALAQLRRRWQERGHDAPALLERKARLLVPLIGDRPDALARAGAVATEIEWAKARLVDPDGYPTAAERARRGATASAAEIADLYARYEHEKHRRRLVDFDDLIVLCVRALENDHDFAAAQRFRFRHFFVDEFQDVTPAQLRLLRAWLGNRGALCVVGDPDQAIYRFAGAEPAYLRDFEKHFPGATVVRLDRNYRSTAPVLAAARAALPRATDQPVVAIRAEGPVPTFTAYATDQEEAWAVARAARDANATGRPWATMAVLYRTNAQSALFEEAFGRAGVPVRVRGGARFLDRPEVAGLLARLAEGRGHSPARRFVDDLIDLDAEAATMSEEVREHAAALVALGREYLAHDGGAGCPEGFVAWLRATMRRGDGELDTADAVDLLSFHRAKGLEYETVFVCGVERGFVPIAHAATAMELEEERRLLYVALSRAATALHVSWADERTLGSRVMPRDPSPWLDAIIGTVSEHADRAARDAEDPVAAVRKARVLLAARAGFDPLSERDADRLLDALRDWRLTAARAAAVPPYAVAPDCTLRAIAAARPTSTSALAAVPGIGPVRLERYGAKILALVASATT
jgi:DNA helicase-2/ATP-dependent DNA helicase PcrA